MNQSGSSNSSLQQIPEADDVFNPQEGIHMLLEHANELINNADTPHADIQNFLTLNYDMLSILFENHELKSQILNSIYAIYIPLPEKPVTNLEIDTEMVDVNSKYCTILQDCINKKSHKIFFINQLKNMLTESYSDIENLGMLSFAAIELIDMSVALKTIIELNHSRNNRECYLNNRVNTFLNHIQGTHDTLDDLLQKHYGMLNESKFSTDKALSKTLNNTLSITAYALGFYVIHTQFCLNSGILSHFNFIQARVQLLEKSLKAISYSTASLDQETSDLQKSAMFQLQLAYSFLQEANNNSTLACNEVQDIIDTCNRLAYFDSLEQVCSFQALVDILKTLPSTNALPQDVFIQNFEKICGYLISMQSKPNIPDVERNTLLILSQLIIEADCNTNKTLDSVPYARTIWNEKYARILELLNYNVHLTLEKTHYTTDQMEKLVARFKKNKKSEIAKIQKYSHTIQDHFVQPSETVQPIEEVLQRLGLEETKKKNKRKKKKKINIATLESDNAIDKDIEKPVIDSNSGNLSIQSVTGISCQSSQAKKEKAEIGEDTLLAKSEITQGSIHPSKQEGQSPIIVASNTEQNEPAEKSESVDIKHEQHDSHRKTDTELDQSPQELVKDNKDTRYGKANNIKAIETIDKRKEKEPKLKENETNLTAEIEFHSPIKAEVVKSKRKNNRTKSQRKKIKKQQSITAAGKQQCSQIVAVQKEDAELLAEVAKQEHQSIEVEQKADAKLLAEVTKQQHQSIEVEQKADAELLAEVTKQQHQPIEVEQKADAELLAEVAKQQHQPIEVEQKADAELLAEVAKQQRQQIEVEQKADAEYGKDLLKDICHGTHATICKLSDRTIIERANKIAAIPFHELIHLLGDIFLSGKGVLVLEEFRRLKLFKHIFNLHNKENEVDAWYSNQDLYYHHIEHMIHQQFDKNRKYENFEDNQLDLVAILLLPALYSYVNQCNNQLDLGCKMMLDALFAGKNSFTKDSKAKNNEYHIKLHSKLRNVYHRHQSFCSGAQFEYARRTQAQSSQPLFCSIPVAQNPDHSSIISSQPNVLTPLYSSMHQQSTASPNYQETFLPQPKQEEQAQPQAAPLGNHMY